MDDPAIDAHILRFSGTFLSSQLKLFSSLL